MKTQIIFLTLGILIKTCKKMEIEDKKRIIENALVNSFVDDYRAYRNTLDIVNLDLKKSKIEYQYTYDEFCVDYLTESLNNLEEIDICSFGSTEQFYNNFWKFNLYNLQCMLNKKLESLGYDFSKFNKNSEVKKAIESPSAKSTTGAKKRAK